MHLFVIGVRLLYFGENDTPGDLGCSFSLNRESEKAWVLTLRRRRSGTAGAMLFLGTLMGISVKVRVAVLFFLSLLAFVRAAVSALVAVALVFFVAFGLA